MLMARDSVAGGLDDEQPARAGPTTAASAALRTFDRPRAGPARERLVAERVARGPSVVTPDGVIAERQQRDESADRARAADARTGAAVRVRGADAARSARRPSSRITPAAVERRRGRAARRWRARGRGAAPPSAPRIDDPRRRRGATAARTASSVSDSSLAAGDALGSGRPAASSAARSARARSSRRRRPRRSTARPSAAAWRAPAVRGDDQRDAVGPARPGRVEGGARSRRRRRRGRVALHRPRCYAAPAAERARC